MSGDPSAKDGQVYVDFMRYTHANMHTHTGLHLYMHMLGDTDGSSAPVTHAESYRVPSIIMYSLEAALCLARVASLDFTVFDFIVLFSIVFAFSFAYNTTIIVLKCHNEGRSIPIYERQSVGPCCNIRPSGAPERARADACPQRRAFGAPLVGRSNGR